MNTAARVFRALAVLALTTGVAQAQDIEGAIEHPLISRYPGQEIAWQHIENYMPYRIAVGPVTGYRRIDDWIETEGRVTRTFYRFRSGDKSYAEIYKNYLDALREQNFEILGEGFFPDRKGVAIGSGNWQGVLYAANPVTKPGEVNSLFAGTSTSGGAGSIIARKERAAGIVYVVLTAEQHSANYVGTLIDIIEVEEAETGLVVVDPEAMGADIEELGRVVLDGLVFDFDKASLLPESEPALEAIATFLQANPQQQFYVVGHTDSVGTFSYNLKLSADRAYTVVAALTERFGIDAGRLQPHGVGPLVPVFSNSSDAGRDKNRRVELVERQREE